jgi:hypothetical protein
MSAETTKADEISVKYVLSEDKQTLTLDLEYIINVDEENPAIFLHWHEDALAATLEALIANPPPKGHYLYDIALNNSTVQDLKTAFVQRIALHAGGVISSNIIAPNTMTQYRNVSVALLQLGFDPVLKAINIPYLADIYKIDDGRKPNIGYRDPLPPPMFGRVQIFN